MTICPMEKFLHMIDFFCTSTACGACDKYQVCDDDDNNDDDDDDNDDNDDVNNDDNDGGDDDDFRCQLDEW